MADDTLGQGLIEGMREVLAWKRGEIALEVVNLDPMPPERIKAIRKKAARSAAKFEARYGISAATVNNWEQGPQKTGPDRAPASQISRLSRSLIGKIQCREAPIVKSKTAPATIDSTTPSGPA